MRNKMDRKLNPSWIDAPNVDLVARTFQTLYCLIEWV
jgi:hypothetical protein